MSDTVTLGEVEQLVAQLPPPERSRLVERIREQLNVPSTEGGAERVRQVRLRLAEELLAECDDIEDDAQGELDATRDLQRLRKERMGQICQSGV